MSTLPGPKSFVYKIIDDLEIEADVYLPAEEFMKSPCPTFLYIHGGGWISGTRKEINMSMLHELLGRGFIVASIDYRLLPEVSINELFDDIRDAESWTRWGLPTAIQELGFITTPDKVVVGGGSAGGHLAMMVPHLWQKAPLAILSFYGPTDFSTLTPRPKTIEALKAIPALQPEIARAAFFDRPRSFTVPNPTEFLSAPRSLLMLELFRCGGLGEFVTGGLNPDDTLRKAGSMPPKQISAISPALLSPEGYPPLYHIIGTEDQIFDENQAMEFATKLAAAGVLSETLIVEGGQHGFDMMGSPGGETHCHVIKPAVDFICQFVHDHSSVPYTRGTVRIPLPADAFILPPFSSA